MGKQCKISGRPFNSFRWQGRHKRWKETCISPDVAREKNVCQACVKDLEYGVEYHVRDHVMQALGMQGPTSEVNKEFWWANNRQKQLNDPSASAGALSTYDQVADTPSLPQNSDRKTPSGDRRTLPGSRPHPHSRYKLRLARATPHAPHQKRHTKRAAPNAPHFTRHSSRDTHHALTQPHRPPSWTTATTLYPLRPAQTPTPPPRPPGSCATTSTS